jgi:hypothetical protein
MLKRLLIRKVWFFKFGDLEINFTPREYQEDSNKITNMIDNAQSEKELALASEEIKKLSDKWNLLNHRWKDELVYSLERMVRFKRFKLKNIK